MNDENANDYFISTSPSHPQASSSYLLKPQKSFSVLSPLNPNINQHLNVPSTGNRRLSSRSRPFRGASSLTADPQFKNASNSTLNKHKNTHSDKKIETSALVLIGDPNCGKTTLIMTYLNKRFTLPPKSVLFETYDKLINFSNVDTSIKLQIWDFPGDEYFDRFRPLGYANAKGVLICFSIDNPETLDNIIERWIPEISTHCPKAFKIIVGIGSEVRADKTKRTDIPSYDQCYKLSKSLDCKYMECSLIDQRSCACAFEQIACWAIDELSKDNKAIKTSSPIHVKKTRPNTSKMNGNLDLGPSEAIEREGESLRSQEFGSSPKRITSYRKHKPSKCSIM